MDDPDVLKLQKMLTDIAQSKPPVGKATIVEVSKAALTAIRHFKHVVHLIEKFILKCKSHHKLYGFYMIDSIVRQAQKKFKHKDVYGPRFAINLRQTLENALTCHAKERPKIVRLLNLWSANKIFEEDTLRPLLQHCRASGLDVDAESVEKAVKGEKADLSKYGSGGLNISPMKAVTTATASSAPSNSTSSMNPETLILKLLSSVNSDYDKVFSSNSRALRKVQDLLNDNVKKHLGSQSKNKIQNILSAGFDYSDDESGDENKNSVDISTIPQEEIDKTTESLFKNSKILDEIRNIYMENGGIDSHGGSSSRHDDRERRRKRSRSSSRERNSDRKRDRSRRSKERERSRSHHRRRSSSPPRHRDDKRDKERRKLGLPSEPKREHLIIGSRTLWLGRLPTNCHDEDIKNALADYGTVEKIQIINSRACGYVTMQDRRTAYKIIDKMSNKLEISRKLVKVSWATGEGVKNDKKLNVFWDSDRGYHEIPWSSLPQRIGALFEGAFVDLETLPPKFKDMYDEKGKIIKPKSPVERVYEQPNLSHVPLPPENPIQVPPPQNSMPSAVPPPSLTAVPPPMPMPNFAGMLPPGLNLNLENKEANLEMLMAAVANGNNAQPGILGPPPPINPAILNTLNAMNVRTQLANLNRPPFPRHEGPLPDQQAAFQQFRGVNNNVGGLINSPRQFNPQIRGSFNNGNGFSLPDMSNPPPNMVERPPPMHFNVPPPVINFAQPPPNISLNPTPSEHQEEPMDIATSPDGPPGV